MEETVIISARGGGKTRAFIEKCHAEGYSLIVCPNNAMCEYVFRRARKMGKDIPMPIAIEEFVNHKCDASGTDKLHGGRRVIEQDYKHQELSRKYWDLKHQLEDLEAKHAALLVENRVLKAMIMEKELKAHEREEK